MFGLNALAADSNLAYVPHSAIYTSLVLALSVFLIGELAIVTAFGFAAQGYLPLSLVFGCAFIGSIAADAFWFGAGRLILKFLHHFQFVERYERSIGPIAILLDKLVGKHIFLSLLFTKFLYGTRALTLVYLATRWLSLTLFSIFDSLGTLIFLVVLFLIGWPLGRELHALLPHYHGWLGFSVLIGTIVVLVSLLHALLRKAVVAEIHEIEEGGGGSVAP